MVWSFWCNTIICRSRQGASFLNNKFSCKSYHTPTVTQKLSFWSFSCLNVGLIILVQSWLGKNNKNSFFCKKNSSEIQNFKIDFSLEIAIFKLFQAILHCVNKCFFWDSIIFFKMKDWYKRKNTFVKKWPFKPSLMLRQKGEYKLMSPNWCHGKKENTRKWVIPLDKMQIHKILLFNFLRFSRA